jgi:hypothetical protein
MPPHLGTNSGRSACEELSRSPSHKGTEKEFKTREVYLLIALEWREGEFMCGVEVSLKFSCSLWYAELFIICYRSSPVDVMFNNKIYTPK